MPGGLGRNGSKLSSQPEAGPSHPRVDKTKTNKPQKEYQACRYFTTPRGCYNGDGCRFLHDGPEPPREMSKICRFYAKGYCLHGSKCWYKHVAPTHKVDTAEPSEEAEPEPPESAEEITCGICFEVPGQFGLLNGCSHPFCLNCLRDWRKSSKKDIHLVFSNIIKTCPLCRAESRFITPSSRFYPLGDPKREELIAAYKESMARINCRYFEKSSPIKRFCPYGSDCFYKHEDPITGTVHRFDYGVEKMMLQYKEEIQRAARRGQARYRLSNPHAYWDPADVVEDLLAELESLSDGPDPLDAFADLNIQDSDVNLETPLAPLPAPFAEADPDAHWPTAEDLENVRSFYDLFARAIRPRDRSQRILE